MSELRKWVLRIIFILILMIAINGFIGPFLISSDQNELVFVGIFLIVSFFVGFIFYIERLYKKYNNKKGEKNG